MHYEGLGKNQIGEYVFETIKYIIPTIPILLVFPYIFDKTNIFVALVSCCIFLIGLIYSFRLLINLLNE